MVDGAIHETVASTKERKSNRLLRYIFYFFLVSLIVPLILQAGPLSLSFYRVVLLFAFFPAMYHWLTGSTGKRYLADYLILGFLGWSVLSFFVLHGVARAIEPNGILVAEVAGTYFLARAVIRGPDDLLMMSRVLFWCCVASLPFAVVEALTEQNVYLQTWSKLGTAVPDVDHESRLGLDRVQGPFEHPIHYGVFGAGLIGLTVYVLGYGRNLFVRGLQTGAVVFAAFLSLSSGPLAAVVAQFGVVFWDRALHLIRTRWYVLIGLVVVAYIAVDILSNRSPFEVAISYLVFNSGTAYSRVLIWNWGWVNVSNNPLWGVGLNEWERAWFMSTSFDMFWLLSAVQNGIMAGALMIAAFFSVFLAIAMRPITDPKLRSYRMGILVSLIGLFCAGWTVHFWKVPLVLYYAILGGGMWLIDYSSQDTDSDDTTSDPIAASRYTRVTKVHDRRNPAAPSEPKIAEATRPAATASRYRREKSSAT